MDNETHEHLRATSSATLSTQLQKRGIVNVFMRGVQRLHPGEGKLIGPAFTLRYVPRREDRAALASLGNAHNPVRRAIEECPSGAVLVVDARREAHIGTLGDILATRLKARGVAGFVSDGAVRDVDAIRSIDLPVFCAGPASPASGAGLLAVESQVPIGCGGVAVYPGDIIVGDADGVVVVPHDLASEVARDAAEQEAIEGFIQRLIAAGRPIPGTYPPTEPIRDLYRAWVAKGKPKDSL
jgi:regulator of RNase E activity RraA